MSDYEESFLSLLVKDPYDRETRLVYADWCDENGKPERAEYIRLSIFVLDHLEQRDMDNLFYRLEQLAEEGRRLWHDTLRVRSAMEERSRQRVYDFIKSQVH